MFCMMHYNERVQQWAYMQNYANLRSLRRCRSFGLGPMGRNGLKIIPEGLNFTQG